jgi:hypothetical protein
LAQLRSRRQARVYGLTGPEALIRNLTMRVLGGEKLRARYDWLYDWQPPGFSAHGEKPDAVFSNDHAKDDE